MNIFVKISLLSQTHRDNFDRTLQQDLSPRQRRIALRRLIPLDLETLRVVEGSLMLDCFP